MFGYTIGGFLDPRSAECSRGIKWQWWLSRSTLANLPVTLLASACIDLRAVRLVTGEALRCDTLVVITRVKRLFAPVAVTPGRRAGVGRRLRGLLSMRVVARAALTPMRVAIRLEIGEHFSHFMTAKALRLTWYERSSG